MSSGNRSAQFAAAWRYGRCPNVRHDTIVVPATMSPVYKGAGAAEGSAQVGDDDMVAFFASPRITAGGGEHGTEVEWRYSYHVIPPGGPAADTVADPAPCVVDGGVVCAARSLHCRRLRYRIWRVTGSVLSSPATHCDVALRR